MYSAEMDKLTKEFCDTTETHFGGHGYAAGYFASLLSTYFDRMPEEVQKQIRWSLQSTIEDYTPKDTEA